MSKNESMTNSHDGGESSSRANEVRTPDQDGVREHEIREAAYRRFEARGGAPGDELKDWLDATAEVDGRAASSRD